jgi:hypothetical protein
MKDESGGHAFQLVLVRFVALLPALLGLAAIAGLKTGANVTFFVSQKMAKMLPIL